MLLWEGELDAEEGHPRGCPQGWACVVSFHGLVPTACPMGGLRQGQGAFLGLKEGC